MLIIFLKPESMLQRPFPQPKNRKGLTFSAPGRLRDREMKGNGAYQYSGGGHFLLERLSSLLARGIVDKSLKN